MPARPKSPDSAPPSAPTTGSLVLGVEADVLTRELIALYLEPHGYVVRLTGSVAEALEWVAGAQPVLFICSEYALERCPREERDALRAAVGAVPVVALLEPDQPPGLTRDWPGVRSLLTKPVRPEALLSALHGPNRSATSPPSLAGGSASGPGAGVLAGFDGLVDQVGMEPPMVAELERSYLERAPHYLDEIAQGLAAGATEQVDQAAHAMKGMCGNLRFGGLVEACDRLRRAAGAGRLDDAAEALQGLRQGHGEILAAMQKRSTPSD